MNIRLHKKILLTIVFLFLFFLLFDALAKNTNFLSRGEKNDSLLARVKFIFKEKKIENDYGIEFMDLSSLIEKHKSSYYSNTGFEKAPNHKNNSGNIIISFVGDISPFDLISGDSINIENRLKNILESSDILIGNLEGVITESTESKCDILVLNCFAFKGNNNFIKSLKGVGFDFLNLANNHSLDFGKNGSIDTLLSLEENGIFSTGLLDQEIPVMELNGIKISVVGFSPNIGTNYFSKQNIERYISKAKEASDVVVAVIHAGAEGNNAINVPFGDEVYLGENRGNTRMIARQLIDAGADMVFGSGPHVLRGIEKYNDKIIAYSLANFISHTNLSKRDLMSISAIISVEIDQYSNVKSLLLTPVYIDGSGMPNFDEDKRAIDMINMLSSEDFDGSIKFDKNGLFVF